MPPFAETADVTVNTSPASGSVTDGVNVTAVSSFVVAVVGVATGASFTPTTFKVNVEISVLLPSVEV